MTKKELAVINSIVERLGAVAQLPGPIFAGTRYHRARTAISDAHYRLAELIYAKTCGKVPAMTPTPIREDG